MAGGGKVRIADRDNLGELARVVNGRLLVSGTGGGAGTDVNIDAVGGNPVTTTVPVSGTVSVNNFPATQPVSGTVTVNQGTSPWVVSGTVNVGNFPATVAVTQSTSPWVVSGTVAVTQPVSVTQNAGSNPWITRGTIIDADVGVVNTLNVERDTDAPTGDPQTGILPIALVVSNINAQSLSEPSWTKLYANTTGALWVQLATSPTVNQGTSPWVVGGSGATNLGKAEDAVHASGDVGVEMLAVRKDTEGANAAAGDYNALFVDSAGRLKSNTILRGGNGTANEAQIVGFSDSVIGQPTGPIPFFLGVTLPSSAQVDAWNYGQVDKDNGGLLVTLVGDSVHPVSPVVTTINLSGSTHGRPIQVTGTASGSSVLIHLATQTTGVIDKVFIYATNYHTATVTLTLEWGTTGAANETKFILPVGETILIIDGAALGGNATADNIKAFASTANVVNVFGRVEREVA